ncbi:MAG: MATE family efflux transporter [Desulfobulbus sp.]|nr:MATE family efflux transporter [Desulfobulbus sp.]
MNPTRLHVHDAGVLLRLTGPLVMAQWSQTAMGFVDTVMSGRYSSIDLAAVAVGSSIFFPVYLFLIGLLNAVTPLVAQAHGRGDSRGINRSIRQGMVIGCITGAAFMPLLWGMKPFMVWMGVEPEVILITDRYLFAISWGLPCGGLFFALKGGGDGLAKPRLSMIAGFIGLVVNIVANYLLIYGKLGLPALGGAGCGWATSLSILVMLIVMALLLARSKISGTAHLFSRRAGQRRSTGGIAPFLKLGVPLAFTLFIECSIFTIIALFIAKLGAEVVAAHQIALNFTSQLYMLPYSLGMALTVRVGFTIGRRRLARLRRVVRTGLVLSLTGSVLTCLIISVFSHKIASLYTIDPAVQGLAAILLIFAAIFQLPDAMQVCCSGILRGCKDTRIPLLLILLSYWGIGLPLGYGFGLANLGGMESGPQGFWIGLICALTAAAVLLGLRVRVMLRRLAGPAARGVRP